MDRRDFLCSRLSSARTRLVLGAMMRRIRLGLLVGATLWPLMALSGEAGRTRTYFVAADELMWNYAPKGDVLAGVVPQTDVDVWLKRGANGSLPIFRRRSFASIPMV